MHPAGTGRLPVPGVPTAPGTLAHARAASARRFFGYTIKAQPVIIVPD